jgi:hypothetical protein
MPTPPTNGDDTIYGTSGDDTIDGLGGDDIIYGRGGDDIIAGGNGKDILDGGKGDDQLSGGDGKDELYGGAGDDILDGGKGDDFLDGGNGDDILEGGKGDDILLGGRGSDIVDGGQGNDIIDGGRGDDILTGGAGDDIFAFTAHSGHDTITKLDAGDKIDLTAVPGLTSASQLSILATSGGTTITLPEGDTIFVKGASVAEVTASLQVACLMRGTMVRTPSGEVPVEALAIGDRVVTVDGTAEPVKWIGRRSYSRAFMTFAGKVASVLLEAGSLGPAKPSRDLYVSPEHAVLVEHALVPAALLVNGTTIRQVTDFDMVEYFHLEFATPQVIFTDGAATESYVDHGNRRMFENHQDYLDLYGDAPAATDRLRRFEAIEAGPALDAIRARLAERRPVAA